MRSYRRARHTWYNIKIDIKEAGHDGVYWNHLALDRVQCRVVMKMGTSRQVSCIANKY
jgi:hypothetical protein